MVIGMEDKSNVIVVMMMMKRQSSRTVENKLCSVGEICKFNILVGSLCRYWRHNLGKN